VGTSYVLSDLEIAAIFPTEATWWTPDREVVCFVFQRDGEKLTGSVRGTAR